MLISRNKQAETSVDNLSDGDLFDHLGSLYMYSEFNGDILCMNLANGELRVFEPTIMVAHRTNNFEIIEV